MVAEYGRGPSRDVYPRSVGASLEELGALDCERARENGEDQAGGEDDPRQHRRGTLDGAERDCDLESLPYRDDAFDGVVGFNSFQYATNPRRALEQARRVARAGAPVVIATWAVPERCCRSSPGMSPTGATRIFAPQPLEPTSLDACQAPPRLSASQARRQVIPGARLFSGEPSH